MWQFDAWIHIVYPILKVLYERSNPSDHKLESSSFHRPVYRPLFPYLGDDSPDKNCCRNVVTVRIWFSRLVTGFGVKRQILTRSAANSEARSAFAWMSLASCISNSSKGKIWHRINMAITDGLNFLYQKAMSMSTDIIPSMDTLTSSSAYTNHNSASLPTSGAVSNKDCKKTVYASRASVVLLLYNI